MKFFILILSLAALSQISSAAVIRRFKRESFAEGFEFTVDFIKHIADATGQMTKSVLKDVPKTDAYKMYREELEAYMAAYEEYTTKKGMCFEKSMNLLEKFMELTDKYEKKDAPMEAKKIDELFNSYDNEKLEKEIEEFVKKAEALGEMKSNEIDDEVEGLRILGKMFEIC
ncbi:uncharacterized protein [Musca autumnalis]|uniref:uncharacterized protein n=1 Tax=Musca autumnalis TaxID=221902 RepID=UPI003CEBE0E5